MHQKDKPRVHHRRGVTRREFLGGAAAITVAPLMSPANPGIPLLDLHQHTTTVGRTDEQLVAHQEYHGVTITMLLPGEGWMLSASVTTLAAPRLRPTILTCSCGLPAPTSPNRGPLMCCGEMFTAGALGFGELKFHVALDSPEMHRVYKLAEEFVCPF